MPERVVITEASVPRLPRGVRLKFDKVRDAWVMLAPERVLVPDEIALQVLQRCTGAPVSAIVDDLAATFDAPREVIVRDVLALLQDLADKGAIAA